MKHNSKTAEEAAFIKENLPKPIVIVGMMGAGKSHVGRKLAKALDVDFYDSDRLIEEKAGCSVSEIFERFGEAKFRQVEKNTILELLGKDPCVIATGGGAVAIPEVLEAVKSRSVSVWLSVDVETILGRLKNFDSRPLLQSGDPEEVLRRLLREREGLYAQADIKIGNLTEVPIDNLQKLINSLYAHLNPDSF